MEEKGKRKMAVDEKGECHACLCERDSHDLQGTTDNSCTPANSKLKTTAEKAPSSVDHIHASI